MYKRTSYFLIASIINRLPPLQKILPSLLLLLTLSLGAAAQTSYPDMPPGIDSTLTRQERGRYWRHAAELAWDWMHSAGSPDTSSIVLPVKLVSSLYNALIHVHNASGIPERDSAIKCGISPADIPSFYWTNELTIDLRQAPWAKAWQKEKKQTGNATIDRMMKEYNLKAHIRSESKQELVVQISASEAAQMWEIERQLLKMKGISKPDIKMATADMGSITASTHGGAWALKYRCGSLNGFSEWKMRELTWYFVVHPDGRVAFDGREGELIKE